MADRPAVNVIPQFGIETTKGTPVAATKRFTDLNVNFTPDWHIQQFRGRGFKNNTKQARHRKMSAGTYDGKLSYGNIIYFLCSLFGKPASVTQIGVTGAYTWTFTPKSSGADVNLQSYTIELGDDQSAEIVSYALFNDLNISAQVDDVTVTGNIIARAANLAGTLTTLTDSADIDEPLVTASDIDIFLDSTSGGLGGTKITDGVTGAIAIPAKFKPKFTLNTANTSFSGALEIAQPQVVATIEAEYNSQMRAILSAFDVNTSPTRFLRWQATGDLIGGSTNYLIQIDFAVCPDKPEAVPELDGSIYGYKFPLMLKNDKGWGKAMAATVINKLATL